MSGHDLGQRTSPIVLSVKLIVKSCPNEAACEPSSCPLHSMSSRQGLLSWSRMPERAGIGSSPDPTTGRLQKSLVSLPVKKR